MLYAKKSPWIIHYDGSSCNGCDIEVLACLTPMYDIERFGIINTGNPKHADIFLVTGSVNEQNREIVKNIYHQMAEPKVVVAIGICATSGGIFRECYNVLGGVDQVIPVDVYVPACAARPEQIIDGVVKALGVLEQKQQALRAAQGAYDSVYINNATEKDTAELLAQLKLTMKRKGDVTLKGLKDFEKECTEQTIMKAVVNGKIIGAVMGNSHEDGTSVHNVFVNPYFQRKGVGKKLMSAFENHCSGSKRFTFNIDEGYQECILFAEACGYAKRSNGQEAGQAGTVILEKVNK